jgi:hypothetical protein
MVLLAVKAIVQILKPELKFDDYATLALLIIAVVPWFAHFLEVIKFGDVEFKFQRLEKQQVQHDEELRQHTRYLGQLFNGLVGDRGRELLAYLRDNKPYTYKYSDDTKQEFRTMLRQLRLLGFIELRDSVHNVIDDKRPNVDLTKEVALTALGSSYLESSVFRAAISPVKEPPDRPLQPTGGAGATS